MQNKEEKGKLFVGGLSWETSKESLLTYFSQFGEVSECVVVMNNATNKSRGFGFVTYKDPNCVDIVLAASPHTLDGKQIDPNGCNRKRVPKGPKNSENGRKKLFVGGLPANIDEAQLRDAFSKFGKVNEVVIVFDQLKQRPRGFGFLTFDAEESVERVVRERFVQINGKQVECKRAEPRDVQMMMTEPHGMMMLAQGPDGTMGLMHAPQGAAAGSAFLCQPGGGFINPADLASAFRGAVSPEMMQQSMPGLRYMTQGHPSSQYVMLAPGSNPTVGGGGGGGGYILPGAGGNMGMILQGANAGHHGGYLLPGAGSGGIVVPGAGGTSYLMPGSGATGQSYLLPGGGGAGGLIFAGGNGQAPAQYIMTYPGADLSAAYGYPSSAAGSYVQMPQAMYSYAKADPSVAVSSLAGTESLLSDKTTPSAAAASYPMINPYTIGLVGGAGESQEDSALRQTVMAPVSGESQPTGTPTPGQLAAAMSSRMGYYLVPNYQTQLSGLASPYGGSVLAGVPGDAAAAAAAQAAILAASPSIAYSQLSSQGLAQGYHPYRR